MLTTLLTALTSVSLLPCLLPSLLCAYYHAHCPHFCVLTTLLTALTSVCLLPCLLPLFRYAYYPAYCPHFCMLTPLLTVLTSKLGPVMSLSAFMAFIVHVDFCHLLIRVKRTVPININDVPRPIHGTRRHVRTNHAI